MPYDFPQFDKQVAHLIHMAVQMMDELTGIYLHGSSAMNSFVPGRSDIDLILVVREKLPLKSKRALAYYLLEHSSDPYPFDVTILHEAILFPWQYPTTYDFYFSERERGRIERDLRGKGWQQWDHNYGFTYDLAAHLTVLHERGHVLFGQPIEYTFPAIPSADYLDSINRMAAEACDKMMLDPVNAILTHCRVFHYMVEHRPTSKIEAAKWGLWYLHKHIDTSVLKDALAFYTGEASTLPFDPIDLAKFVAYLDAKISQRMIEYGHRRGR